MGRDSRVGDVVLGLWPLMFLGFMVEPVRDSSAAGPRGWVAAAALLTVSVGYVVVIQTAFRAFRQNRDHAGRVGQIWFAIMGAAAVVALLSFPSAAVASLPYLGVASVMCTPLRAAYPFSTALALLGWLVLSGGGTWVILAIFVSVVGTSMAVLGVRRGQQAQEAQEANAHLALQDERNRMARDLHDILGHTLTVVTVKAELAGRLMDLDPVRAKAELADLEQLSRAALADVRRTVSEYRELSLAGELAGARQALTAAGIRPVLPGTVDEVSPDLREFFAWVVREGTTNVIRHSGATRCEIRLTPTSIEVLDDGGGAPAATPGNGLAGLAERGRAVGAVVEQGNLPDAGFRMAAHAPHLTAPSLPEMGSST